MKPDEPPLQLSPVLAIAAAPPVKVEDRATTLFLDNGLVSCEVDKETGSLVSLRRVGDERNLLGASGSWYIATGKAMEHSAKDRPPKR